MIEKVFLLVMGAFWIVGAFYRKTVLRPALSFGKGPGYYPTTAQRVVMVLLGVVLILAAFRLV